MVNNQLLISILLKAWEGIYFLIFWLFFSLKMQKKYTELYMRREESKQFRQYWGFPQFLRFLIRLKYKNFEVTEKHLLPLALTYILYRKYKKQVLSAIKLQIFLLDFIVLLPHLIYLLSFYQKVLEFHFNDLLFFLLVCIYFLIHQIFCLIILHSKLQYKINLLLILKLHINRQ